MKGGEYNSMKKLFIIAGFLILTLATLFSVSHVQATFKHNVWQTSYGEWGACVPNEGNDCGEAGGTQTRTVTKTCTETNGRGEDECKISRVFDSCPEGYHPFLEGTCEKDGVQFHVVTRPSHLEPETQTSQETQECEVSQEEVKTCEEPPLTPTPAPSCTGECGGWSPRPEGEHSTTEAPQCTNGTTMKVPANLHVVRNGEEATVNFFVTEGDRAFVYWSVVGQPHWGNSSAQEFPNGVPINGDRFVSYTVHGLDPNMGYDFGASQHNGCGGGEIETVTGVVVDGPRSTTFGLSYYEAK